jgi:Ca2+/Na+ antiporter
MDEIASARPERMVTMVNEIVNRREEIRRIILIVILAGIALSFIVNIMSNYIWDETNCFIIVISCFLFVMILGYCIYYASKSYAGDIKRMIHFEILFPFRRSEKIEALDGSYYKILTEYQQRVREFFAVEAPEVQKVAEEWKKIVTKNYKTLEVKEVPMLLQFLNDMAEFFIFDTLVNFTNKYLTGQANYQRFGWKRPNYKERDKIKEFKRDEEILIFKTNLIFRYLPVRKNLKFLDGFEIIRKEKDKATQKKSEFGFFEFASKYGKILFAISPFPIIMGRDSRDTELISRYCHNLKEESIVIKIPFVLEIDLKGPKIIDPEFIDIYAPWLEDLIDYVQHNLDWQHCAQYDLERMAVELLGKEV